MKLQTPRIFDIPRPIRQFGWGDAVVICVLVGFFSFGVRIATMSEAAVTGTEISLSTSALPLYATLSLLRMGVAYILSLIFALVYGYLAAQSRRSERILMPLLDILQSVPILSFLPVALLSFSVLLPARIAAEFASIFLIFTCQAWNLILTWYQSLTTIPKDLQEVGRAFRLSLWQRLRVIELPFAVIGLIWNSMVSWSNGWFFLMASETFRVGERDFRLPGIGSYLQEAAVQGELEAMAHGIGTLILLIVFMDQLVWRPMLSWAERFKLETVSASENRDAWFYRVLQNSRFAHWFFEEIFVALGGVAQRWLAGFGRQLGRSTRRGRYRFFVHLGMTVIFVGLVVYGSYFAMTEMATLRAEDWGKVFIGLGATFFRVCLAMALALAWTLIVGELISSRPSLASWLQPFVQVAAAVPATALFPVVFIFFVDLPGGLELAAVLLMMMAAQWYLLFNIIAGACAIPWDLRYVAELLQLNRKQRWKRLTLPAILPYVVTGGLTSSGGAWNACIVAEYVEFSGRVEQTIGVGALIAKATAQGDSPMLLAASLTVILVVVFLNRVVWRRLYLIVEERYRME